MIIAIDFDGTIVSHEFPNIGDLKPNVQEVITRLKEQGHTIIIWTCRTLQNKFPGKKSTVIDVHNFLIERNIPFDEINMNASHLSFQPYPKVYADVYIDDRQLGGIPDDWEEIYDILICDIRIKQ